MTVHFHVVLVQLECMEMESNVFKKPRVRNVQKALVTLVSDVRLSTSSLAVECVHLEPVEMGNTVKILMTALLTHVILMWTAQTSLHHLVDTSVARVQVTWWGMVSRVSVQHTSRVQLD